MNCGEKDRRDGPTSHHHTTMRAENPMGQEGTNYFVSMRPSGIDMRIGTVVISFTPRLDSFSPDGRGDIAGPMGKDIKCRADLVRQAIFPSNGFNTLE
jgi:hypothetical protein